MKSHRCFARRLLQKAVLVVVVVCWCLFVFNVALSQSAPTTEPLRISISNPRYFTDRGGKAIYLTGSHTWNNRQDFDTTVFDYMAYLNFLVGHNHNFIRLYVWEEAKGLQDSNVRPGSRINPTIYARTGPGRAKDGSLKFNVNQFNEEFFNRLRSRVIAAGNRGIYVSIMLFNGWSIEKKGKSVDPWNGHPFNQANNANNVNGDPNKNGNGEATHTLQLPAIRALHEAYVRKVIDTVSDLDNVLYEVSNETSGTSAATDWEYYIINYVKQYEATKPKQHPIGMTVQWPDGNNTNLYHSPADWISPNPAAALPYDYKTNPPPANGSKVVISDTDHLWGIGGDRVWAWKSFLRGLNIIYMDTYLGDYINIQANESLRENMGYILTYARKMNLMKMISQSNLCSTGYCLANTGATDAEYLVYVPSGGRATVNLTATTGQLCVDWFNPSKGAIASQGITTGGANRLFVAPFRGDAVLHIYSQSDTISPMRSPNPERIPR